MTSGPEESNEPKNRSLGCPVLCLALFGVPCLVTFGTRFLPNRADLMSQMGFHSQLHLFTTVFLSTFSLSCVVFLICSLFRAMRTDKDLERFFPGLRKRSDVIYVIMVIPAFLVPAVVTGPWWSTHAGYATSPVSSLVNHVVMYFVLVVCSLATCEFVAYIVVSVVERWRRR